MRVKDQKRSLRIFSSWCSLISPCAAETHCPDFFFNTRQLVLCTAWTYRQRTHTGPSSEPSNSFHAYFPFAWPVVLICCTPWMVNEITFIIKPKNAWQFLPEGKRKSPTEYIRSIQSHRAARGHTAKGGGWGKQTETLCCGPVCRKIHQAATCEALLTP